MRDQLERIERDLPPTGPAPLVEALLTFRKLVTHSDGETRREAERLVATWRAGDAGALTEALKKYGEHLPDCASLQSTKDRVHGIEFERKECNCGFAAALAASGGSREPARGSS